jgi:protein-L-isoaspartate(D-aspartate) O-methyltransferase
MTGIAEQQRRQQPDPARPAVQNGGFEEALAANGFVPGWYYQRNLQWLEDPLAPQGTRVVGFQNEIPGQPAHLLQGFPVDGRQVTTVELSAWVRHEKLNFDRLASDFPAVSITFYDERRQDLGNYWIGPFRGTSDWRRVSERIRVPPSAREGILRIGLFGATGSIFFDDVRIEPAPQAGSRLQAPGARGL